MTLISTGAQTPRVVDAADLLAAEGIDAHVVHVPTIKPLDVEAIVAGAERTGRVITVEEHIDPRRARRRRRRDAVRAPTDAHRPDRAAGPLPGVRAERRAARHVRPVGGPGRRAGGGDPPAPLTRRPAGRGASAARPRSAARGPSRLVVVVLPALGEVGAGVLEVLPKRRHDELRIARPEGGHDGRMEAGRPVRVGAGRDERDVGPRERLERPPDALEGGVAGQRDQAPVEAWRRPGRPRGDRRRRRPAASPRGGASISARSASVMRGTPRRAPSASSSTRTA